MTNWYETLETSLGHNVADLKDIGPEMVLAGTFLTAMIWDFMQKKTADKASVALICIVGIVASLFAAVLGPGGLTDGTSAFMGMIQVDPFSTFFKIIIGVATIVALVMAMDSWEIQRLDTGQGEFYYLLLAACFGGYLLASATNLLLIYLAVETLSLTSYALAGYLPGSRKSAEAGMKYVIYGAMASGIMIFGMSYLFGMTGSLDVHTIARSLQKTVADWGAAGLPNFEYTNRVAGLAIMFLMVFAGFAYKISAAPFHFWAPDVYEGAPTVATAFFSVGPKAAGFAGTIRLLAMFFYNPQANPQIRIFVDPSTIQVICGLAAVATMFVGNLTALAQTNAKRMLAYSSIAHAGYMLAALTVPSLGFGPLLFYLIAYLFMNFGAFMVVMALEQKRGSSDVAAFGGAVKTDPWLTVTMCVFLFGLVGMPPLSGFVGKFLIFKQLADPAAGGATSWHWLLIALMGINSVISLFYYIRIARVMIVDPVPTNAPLALEKTPISLSILTIAFAAITLMLGIYFAPAMEHLTEVGYAIMR